MNFSRFENFFQGRAREYLIQSIDLALAEDGRDLTSRAAFTPEAELGALVVAKQPGIVAGLPLVPLIMERAALAEPGRWDWRPLAEEGRNVQSGATLFSLKGGARLLLKSERIIINFISHISGIANLTASYVEALAGSGIRLLDTRKTLPGLRFVEKYGVLMGGGHNHRRDLEEMLMLKDNHIDAAGSIAGAVALLRAAYSPCPPIEVECRDLDEVTEAVAAGVNRIMLDNMPPSRIGAALARIPRDIETEVSGGVSLDNIRAFAMAASAKTLAAQGVKRGLDFISVGRLTHSAPAADFSMRLG